MSHYWLLITFSWLSPASPQFISSSDPADVVFDTPDPMFHYQLPYVNYIRPPRADFETYQNQYENAETYSSEEPPELQRKRRTTEEEKTETKDRQWLPNLVDTDKTTYFRNDDKTLRSPIIIQELASVLEDNGTEMNILEPEDKKSFSPWGGKRDKPTVEHMWTWKRSAALREPSMPKRVRFSPWGGKRSGRVIVKPGTKGSKIIFSTSMPELTRIVSNYSPTGERFDLAGFHFIPALDKRHPIKILALSTRLGDGRLKEALPFKKFIDFIPKIFKPGHPYSEINLKKDGKRKVKFSAWGGKRSPPIIGPIWTPAPDDIQESNLNALLLIRNSQENEATKAV